MASQEHTRIAAPAADASGAAKRVTRMTDVLVQVWGTFTATVTVEYRVHPDADWETAGSALTMPGTAAVPDAAIEIRCTTSGYSAGDPEAAFGATVLG